MKISKTHIYSYFISKVINRFIFLIFLTSPFVNKAENKILLLDNYNLSSNFSLNPFSDYLKKTSLFQNQNKTICSNEPIGVTFYEGNNGGVPVENFMLIIDGELDSGLIPSIFNEGEIFFLQPGDILDDSYRNTTDGPLQVIYRISPTDSNGNLGEEFQLIVTVNPAPVVPQSEQNQERCSLEPLGIEFNESSNNVVAASYNIIAIINSADLVPSAGNIAEGTGFSRTALSNDSFKNNTSNPLNVTYTVVPVSATGCVGDAFSVTVSILPVPEVANQTTTVCRNQPIGIILGDDTDGPSAFSYNIINIDSNGLSPFQGNPTVRNDVPRDEISDDAWSNPTSIPIDVVYTVEPVGLNCVGDPFTVTVTVNPELSVADQPILVCSGEEVGVNFNASSSIAAATYNIIGFDSGTLTEVFGDPGIGTGLSADDLADDTFNNSTTEDITAVYTVVPFDNLGCEGAPFTVSVTVKPDNLVPVVNDQIATSSVSSRGAINVTLNPSINLNAPAASYRITGITSTDLTPGTNNRVVGDLISADGIFNDTFRNTTNAPVNVIYSIVPISASGCEGDAFTVTVGIRPEPEVADQTLTVCNEQALGITLNGSTNGVFIASYNITGINKNGLTASAGSPVVTDGVPNNELFDDAWPNPSNAPLNVVYTVVPVSSDGVLGGSFTVTVTVNPVPKVANQTIEVCSDDTLTLDLNAVIVSGGTSFKYTIDDVVIPSGLTRTGPSSYGTGSNALNGDSFTNITGGDLTVVYTVTPYIEIPGDAADCAGEPFTVTVTVNPSPVVLNQTVLNISSRNPVSVSFNLSSSIAAATYNITALNLNGLTVVSGNPSVSSGLLATSLSDDSFRNTTNAPVDVIYTVVPVSTDGCKGEVFTVTVTINPEPVVADQTATVCMDEPIGVTLNPSSSVAVASYNIVGINSNGLTATSGITNTLVGNNYSSDVLLNDSYTNPTNAPVKVVYTIVPVSAQGVEGGEFTLTVTVNPELVVAAQVIEVCSGEEVGVAFNASTSIAAATYNITALNLNGLTVVSGNPSVSSDLLASALSDDSFRNTTNAPVDVIYTVVPYDAIGCNGDAFTVTVTVNPSPVVLNQTVLNISSRN
uniref:PKD-like domain-containing protein n=1 Tax=Polaribacter sp. TaxID=1920175 RepID=UPI004047FCAC